MTYFVAQYAASVALALHFFFPPGFFFGVDGLVAPLGAVLFTMIGVAAGWLGDSRLKALEQLRAAMKRAAFWKCSRG